MCRRPGYGLGRNTAPAGCVRAHHLAGSGAAQRSQRILDDVEAVDGSVSALYGSNAVGGVAQGSPATAAITRCASTVDDLYYPFSGNPLVAPSVAIAWGGALIDNVHNLFSKDQ
jgi:hypothetical protein